jgi:hypothetical protein
MLFDPDIQALLASQGISLITHIPAPIFIPEAINGYWYHRYDVSARFNQLVTYQKPIPIINSTNITLEDAKGVITQWQS